jgi:hypothetical protein
MIFVVVNKLGVGGDEIWGGNGGVPGFANAPES